MNKKIIALYALVGVIALGFGIFTGYSQTTAKEMRLEHFTGVLRLSNHNQAKEVVAGSRLVTGDDIATQTASQAYISLDSSKILMLDEVSNMEIVKSGQNLDIELLSGSVFFNVTSPLTQEESLEFHSANLITGVRGTSGIVSYDQGKAQTQVVVLSGTVSVETQETEVEIAQISAGEVAIATTLEDGSVQLEVRRVEDDFLARYYSSEFVAEIQADLDKETQAVALSSQVEETGVLRLSTEISVIGDSRVMSPAQAAAFAQILEENSDISYVTFFDGGNGVLVMVPMVIRADLANGGDVRTYCDSQIVQWDGSSATLLPVPYGFLTGLYWDQGGYTALFERDGRSNSDVQLDWSSTQYSFENGMQNEAPDYFFYSYVTYYKSESFSQSQAADFIHSITQNLISRELLVDTVLSYPVIDYIPNGFLIEKDSIEYIPAENSMSEYDPRGQFVASLSAEPYQYYEATPQSVWSTKEDVLLALRGQLPDAPLPTFTDNLTAYQELLYQLEQSRNDYIQCRSEIITTTNETAYLIDRVSHAEYTAWMASPFISSTGTYYLHDIDQDGTPELFYLREDDVGGSVSTMAFLYTLIDGKVTNCSSFSTGTGLYFSDTPGMFQSSYVTPYRESYNTYYFANGEVTSPPYGTTIPLTGEPVNFDQFYALSDMTPFQ